MKNAFLLSVMVLGIGLSACTSSAAAQPSAAKSAPADTAPYDMQPLMMGGSANHNVDDLTRIDQQGMVSVEVTPLNLKDATGTLNFEVAMNTHSVDLSMDLATLTTLTTDTGVTVQAYQWDATPGGHHVSGQLMFPAEKDGKPILSGAARLTLTIRNVDAPERTFVWELQ